MRWLREHNPDIDWHQMSLRFQNAQLSAVIPMLPHKPPTVQPRRPKATVEDIEDVDDIPFTTPPQSELFPEEPQPEGEEEKYTRTPSEPKKPAIGNFPRKAGNQHLPSPKPKPPKPTTPRYQEPNRCPDPDGELDIKIIGAAPFANLIRDGEEIYMLNITPVSENKILRGTLGGGGEGEEVGSRSEGIPRLCRRILGRFR